MNWFTFALVNATWIVCLLLMRRRYRRLMGEALETLDYVHRTLTPYIGQEGEVRAVVGVKLSNLCVDAGIRPWKRRGE